MEKDEKADEGNNPEEKNEDVSNQDNPAEKNDIADKLKAMGVMSDEKISAEQAVESNRGKRKKSLLMILAAVVVVLAAIYFWNSGKTVNQDDETEVAVQGSQSYARQPTPYSPPAAILPEPLGQEDQKALSNARNAFWQQDLEAAEKAYQELTERVADNPDLLGELGNVLFHQNKYDQAVEKYYQAGLLLIAQNRLPEASRTVSVIARFDRNKANALLTKMYEAQR